MQFQPFRTTAAQVRTGMVIQTTWTRDHYSLEVETVHHERFVSPEGVVAHVVRFTGWELFLGKPRFNDQDERTHRVIRGWGQRAHTLDVRVLDDLRPGWHQCSPTFGALTGRADATILQVELESFLAELPGA